MKSIKETAVEFSKNIIIHHGWASEDLLIEALESFEEDIRKDEKLKHDDLRKSLSSMTLKAKLFMVEPACNDFTAHIEHAEEVLKNLKPLKAV